jgi:SAM-dependent methyltransferase
LIDEMRYAGRENLDAGHGARYDVKEDASAIREVALLKGRGLTRESLVLEFGARTGQFSVAAAPECARVIAVDISELMLDQLIRKVAARNDAVGRGLLVTVLPRASISQGEFSGMLIAAPAQEERQTFLYVPVDDRKGFVCGPTVVSGGAVLTDFMAGSLDAPEMADLKRAVDESRKTEGS